MNDVLIYNNWDPLEEIWLGDTYPEHFYDDLQPEIRDNFYKITEWTKEDLNSVQKKFEEFNVTVKRPLFKDKSHYIDEKLNKLIKPPICPRDDNVVIGNKLFYSKEFGGCFEDMASTYNPKNVSPQSDFLLSGAGTVKLGRDLLFDFMSEIKSAIYLTKFTTDDRKHTVFQNFRNFERTIEEFKKDYRIHYSTNGGHVDGCFMPVRPGLVLGNSYWSMYDITLPKWKKLYINEPTYKKEQKSMSKFSIKHPHTNSKWLVPQLSNQKHFNKFLERYCGQWIGNYKETYFEVNIIMLDENNMMCIDTSGIHEPLFEILNKEGINIHVVPWRTRNFWDGGLHCITLDVRRKATKLDYFPERGENGIKSIFTSVNKNSLENFYTQYYKWLESNVS
jgi:hypothetical protein